MIRRLLVSSLAASILTLPAATAQETETKIAAALEILKQPDLSSAKTALKNLEAVAAETRGEEKEWAERISEILKETFTAEFQVQRAIEKRVGEVEKAAAQQESNARSWETRTKLGRSNRAEAAKARAKAKQIRLDGDKAIHDRQLELHTQLKEMDNLTLDLYNEARAEETVLLFGVMKAVASRSLAEGLGFTSRVTIEGLERMEDMIRNRGNWIKSAENAEEAGNYELAIDLYAKLNDQDGRKRNALTLAKELEDQKLIGSAIEYFEMGGDFAQARRLREKYPKEAREGFASLDSKALYAKVSPSVVRIRVKKGEKQGHGSGFFFNNRGYILTNNHVIDGADSIEVRLHDERAFDAELVHHSEKPDLAVLRVKAGVHDSLRFGTSESVAIGTTAALIGFPQLDMPTATMNTGKISNTDRGDYLQLDLSANPGNSGGPVVDAKGRVIGILTSGVQKEGVDRFNFAIRVDIMKDFLLKEMGDGYERNKWDGD